jgi:RNA polymerase sigma-70 factor (ECF subfamily)
LAAIRAVLAGDRNAFGRLVNKYGDSLFNLARRLTGSDQDAEDLAQEAFLRAYAGLRDFRVGSRFHPWLYTITLNLCRNHLRRRSILRWVPLQGVRGGEAQPELDPPAEASNPEQALLGAEGEARLQAAVAALPLKYREVFLLRQSEGLTYDAIAELTGLPLGTVEVRLFRARKRLLAALEAQPGRRTRTK